MGFLVWHRWDFQEGVGFALVGWQNSPLSELTRASYEKSTIISSSFTLFWQFLVSMETVWSILVKQIKCQETLMCLYWIQKHVVYSIVYECFGGAEYKTIMHRTLLKLYWELSEQAWHFLCCPVCAVSLFLSQVVSTVVCFPFGLIDFHWVVPLVLCQLIKNKPRT